ncbi:MULTISPECIES: efflux transporter outer membrane subunit [unclassified Rhodanobacter]|uniref:Efflux transporter outer membrane subunit n=1 Tax=Rhodanobacter humi TaxID=1888173 RepID=A0ABV4AVR3_9GAMM
MFPFGRIPIPDRRCFRTTSAVLAVALLAACASPRGLRTQAVPVEVNALHVSRSLAVVRLSPAAWPSGKWWRDYGDPQLDALIGAALRDQPGLRVAEARVRAAGSLAAIAGAVGHPKVGAGAHSTRERFSDHGTVPPPVAGSWQTVNDVTVGAAWELDFWGRNRAAVDATLDREHAAEVDVQAARLMLTTAIARTYLRLDAAYAQRDLTGRTLVQREQILALTRKRVAAGLDSQLELTQAEAALPATREQVAAIDESIALLDNQLAALAGHGPDDGKAIQRPQLAAIGPINLPGNLPVELIGRRPDVIAERWRVEAAGRDIDVARAQFYPNVSLGAFVGLQRLGFDDFLDTGSRIMGVGPAISLPIFDGGRLRGNLGLHQAAYDAAVEAYNATVIGAVHDVVDQLVSLDAVARQRDEQAQALSLSEHAYELAQHRYRAGLASYLQVLSAETQVLAQRQQTLVLQTRGRELRLALIRALGGGYVPDATATPGLAHRR